MRLVLDSGGLTALASDRARLAEVHTRGLWPAIVPVVVLTESLTGDHRRDHAVNRLLAMAELVEVDEPLSRVAATLRTAVANARISAVDAIVAATAEMLDDAVVVTSDVRHLRALAAVATRSFAVVGA